jgi:hypothetical protein
LSGETQPIDIHIRKYSVTREGNDATLTVIDATASRQWVAEALREFVVGHSFSIPTKARVVLELLT